MVEWPFYVKFSLLGTGFESNIGWVREYFYLFTVESVYTRDQRRCTEAERDPQNILNPRKNLRIFRRRYIVGTLTNKANISI